MDELDLLKKDWKKQESSFQQIGEKEIYGMLHKRSSSIVKWIVIISVLELLLWTSISFFTADEEYFKTLKMYHLDTSMPIIAFINYGVILFFIYLFFKNYRAINTTDTVKQLMQSILKTQKTVKYYVWYNLVLVGITSAIVIYSQFMFDEAIHELYNKSKVFLIIIGAIFILIILLSFWLFYKILYLKYLQFQKHDHVHYCPLDTSEYLE